MITTFTPFEALLGGALIGVAAVALMAVHGRIAGMTGILTGAILPKGDWGWRLAFLVGAIAAPMAIVLITGTALPVQTDIPAWAIALGGLLVGIGVTFGGGCTSGHGVCGMARLSGRSIVATATFMATTFITVFVVRHLIRRVLMLLVVSAASIGLVFGVGIVVSGMANPAKVLNFFDVFGTWDPSLMLVMASALIVTVIGYRAVLRRSAPALDRKFHLPARRSLDLPLIGGSALFGIGWGIAGFCPGGAIPALGSGQPGPFVFVAAMIGGILLTTGLRSISNRRQALVSIELERR